jgi:phosphoserine phosphatase
MTLANSTTSNPVALAQERAIPLCVDLDETLIRTDLLLESLLLLARQRPLMLLSLPFWLMRGRAYFKHRIAETVNFDAEFLPYDADVVAWLGEEKGKGRQLVLATASNRRLAASVAEHLGLFDLVLASDEDVNLKGRRKLEALVARFGVRGFDYAADARADIPIWWQARNAILVRPARGVAKALQGRVPIAKEFPRTSRGLIPILKAMRVRQ